MSPPATHFTISLIGHHLNSGHTEQLQARLAPQNIVVTQQAELLINDDQHITRCQQFSCLGDRSAANTLKQNLTTLTDQHQLDLVVHSIPKPAPHLVCFDMDSTLIQIEVIDELAKLAGIGDQVAEITARAMRGELDFTNSFKARMKLLKGLNASVLDNVADTLPLTPGAVYLFQQLRAAGFKTAILSGGFDFFARRLQMRLCVDDIYANQLDIQNGHLTGNTITPIVDGGFKANALKQLASHHGIDLSHTVAVGDGANDLPMLHTAELGVAFHAKPAVIQSAPCSIRHSNISSLLFLLGLS